VSEQRNEPDVERAVPEADRLGVPDHRRPDGSGRSAGGGPAGTTQTSPQHDPAGDGRAVADAQEQP
jgi:hypothetical protein